jgi:hypothetical protein
LKDESLQIRLRRSCRLNTWKTHDRFEEVLFLF